MQEKTYTLNIRRSGTWQYDVTIPEINVLKTAPTLESALNITFRDIIRHFTARSLILVFAGQSDDKNALEIDSQQHLHTNRKDQAAFEVVQQGIAQYVKRKEHHLIFTLAQPLTRAQTLWLDTQAGKLFDQYFVTDTYGEELASLWEEVRDHWEAKNYE